MLAILTAQNRPHGARCRLYTFDREEAIVNMDGTSDEGENVCRMRDDEKGDWESEILGVDEALEI